MVGAQCQARSSRILKKVENSQIGICSGEIDKLSFRFRGDPRFSFSGGSDQEQNFAFLRKFIGEWIRDIMSKVLFSSLQQILWIISQPACGIEWEISSRVTWAIYHRSIDARVRDCKKNTLVPKQRKRTWSESHFEQSFVIDIYR